jgi:hypothetical protein
MFYGFRLNEQKDWVKIKTFNTIEEFKEYTEKRKIVYAKLIDEKTYNKYYLGHNYEEPKEEEE